MKSNSEEEEGEGKNIKKNDTLLSDFALTKRRSRSLYRNWTAVSKKPVRNSLQSQTNAFSKISTSSLANDFVDCNKDSSSTFDEDRIEEIVRHLEQNHVAVVDLKSNKNRMEALREMTEYLTLKRSVKRKLIKSMGCSSKTVGFSKRLKYKLGIFLFKIPVTVKHFFNNFELWYSSLKVIEGHFGSNVAGYFKFLRKLFLLNACIFTLMFFFIMIPQLLFRFVQYVDDNQNDYSTLSNSSTSYGTNFSSHYFRDLAKTAPLVMIRANPYEGNDQFRLGNIFTGEGFLTNTILFYGYYTNTSLKLFDGYSFNIPASYFFTSTVCYIIIFLFLFISVAVSYRKCYIEASGGMHNTFTNRVFCGWDFGIATKQAAELKSRSIFIDIKELLDGLSKQKKRKSCASTLYTAAISISLNCLLLFLLAVGGMYSWKYLDQQMTMADTATTMMMWLILTLVIAIAPVLFSLITNVEGFESPSTALYMTLIRTFTLYAIVIAVVVAYRLNRSSESECWETILGQDMFRLVVLDFIFGSVGTALSEFIRYRIFKKMWRGIGCPEFDIARSTMNLVYNQTLFYIGLFFSPVLSLLITIKLFIIFYVKKWGAVHNCRPFVKPWKASQAHTVYLSIAFLAFFCVVIAYGYIITSVKTSNCGPFRGKRYVYEIILREILSHENSTILKVFYYVTRPGVVGIVLIAMLLGVYYMRAVALARIHVVKHLRHLLRLKAEDRKLLLSEISKYTKPRAPPDPPPQSEVLQNSQVRSSSFRLSKSTNHLPDDESRKKLINSEQHDKGSSISNILNEKEKQRRSGMNSFHIFSSLQNINSSGQHENVELNSNFCDSIPPESETIEKNIFYEPLAAKSNFEESFEEDTTESTSKASESPEHEVSDKNKVNAFDGVAQLNFNPVFTESAQFYSDDEEKRNVSAELNRSSALSKKRKRSASEPDDFSAQSDSAHSYNMNEERIPSRISFNFEKKKTSHLEKKN